MTTSSVVGPKSSSKAVPKAKLAPKKGHGHCLVVCCWTDPLELSESQQNHYLWEVRSANRDAPKTTNTCSQYWSTERAQFFPPEQPDCTSHNQCFKSWTNWATEFCLILHIHLTSRQSTATSLSMSTTFCRESTSTTSRRQKMLSKSSSNPEAWIFMLQE